MNFSLNEEQLSLQETVKKFAKNELTEIAKKMEQEDKSADKSVLKKFADLGILGVNLPKKYGGVGILPAAYGLLYRYPENGLKPYPPPLPQHSA